MTTPMIECQGLTKRYGTITALKGVSLSIAPGVVGLLGPNGAGKSTLISMLLGQTPPTAGTARVLGLDIRSDQSSIRQRIGYVPENDCTISGMSGVGYTYYCARLAGMRHDDAMQRTHEVLDYVGMEEARYRPSDQYSTGMKQSLKLAQAIVHDPDVVFLDEPTNGMDPNGRELMLTLIGELGKAGIGVLLSSHLLPDVERLCDRVVIMGGGEVLSEGRIEEMNKPHPTLYRVDYGGDGAGFHRRLVERGVRVLEQVDGYVQIELPEEGRQRLVLESARDCGVRVIGLKPKRSSLEETFLRALGRQQKL
jgi:ABC-2 type transport system ATP-binding protein